MRYLSETRDPRKQRYCIYPRNLYIDIQKQCVDCHRPFIFFAKEQQYWFE
ncbi:zinc-ribbon domain containing protein [Pseudoalteromonas sp. Ld20]